MTLNKQNNYGSKQFSIGGDNKPNATMSAQFNNLVNGTTSGNLAFTLNRPLKATASAYMWANPLARVLTRNNNKNIQWQIGRGQLTASASAGSTGTVTTTGAGASPAPAKPAAAPAPAAAPKPAAPSALKPAAPAGGRR